MSRTGIEVTSSNNWFADLSPYISNEACHFLSWIIFDVRTNKTTLELFPSYILSIITNIITRPNSCKNRLLLDKHDRDLTVKISICFDRFHWTRQIWRSKVNDHLGLKDTGWYSTYGHCSNPINSIDIIKG
jgi:hypothetical protein